MGMASLQRIAPLSPNAIIRARQVGSSDAIDGSSDRQLGLPTRVASIGRTMPKQRRGGFASMDPEQQRAIASMGGKAAHERGHAHEFSSEEARAAGAKGGQAVSQDRAHMAEIGRRGGQVRSKKRREGDEE
jgi:uncharacterized protein